MLVEDFLLTPSGTGQVIVTWTPLDPTWIAWVYLNGQLQGKPIRFEEEVTAREVSVGWDPNETHVLEIHEAPEGVTVKPIHCQLWIHPTISWNSVSDAERYRLYWRGPGATTETLLFDDRVEPDDDGICHVYSPLSGEGESNLWWTAKSASLFASADRTRQFHLSLSALDGRGGTWHFFRIKAVDNHGNESTCQSWAYWAAAPENGKSVSVTNGSATGLYNITIVEPTYDHFGHPDF